VKPRDQQTGMADDASASKCRNPLERLEVCGHPPGYSTPYLQIALEKWSVGGLNQAREDTC